MKKIYVRTSEGRIEEQENDKIVNSLMKEAELNKKE